MWSNGDTAANISNLPGGTYQVVVKDSLGCTDSVSVLIAEPSPIQIQLTAFNSSCNSLNDGAINTVVSGGMGSYQYSWSNGATTVSLSGIHAGNYVVYITDANACVDSAAATILQPQHVLAQYQVNNDTLQLPNAQLILNNTSYGASNFSWSFGDGAIDTLLNPVHNYTLPGTYAVSLIAFNPGGCYDTITGNIVVLGQLTNANEILSGAGTYVVHSNNVILININLPESASGNIQVCNTAGQIVNEIAVSNIKSQKIEFTSADMAEGVYYIRFVLDKGAFVLPLLINR
jgi:PKD repeat protein